MRFPSPEEGGPYVEGILRSGGWGVEYGHRAPKIDTKEGFNHRHIMQVITLKSCNILQGGNVRARTHGTQTG